MNKDKLKKGQKITQLAFLLVVFLAGSKAAIAFLSGSILLLSDAVHSATDLLPILACFFALKIAQKKASKHFPYGFYKAENLATLLISFLIFYGAYQISREGLGRLSSVAEIKIPLLALSISLIDAFVLYLFGKYQIKAGKEINSQSLTAIGKENKTHLFSSLAVFGGVLASYFQLPFVEGIGTLIIALLLFSIGFSAFKDSLFSLMDVSPSKEIEKKVAKAIEKVTGIEELFDLKLRKSGPFIFGETKVGIRKSIDVSRAHEIANKVEKKVKKAVPQIESLIVHIKPFETDYRHLAIPVSQKRKLNSLVDKRFARASCFLFVNFKAKKIKSYYFLKNPYRDKKVRVGLACAKLIVGQKIDILLTKQIGEIALHALRDNLVDVYKIRGKTAKEVINHFNKGSLEIIRKATKEKI